MLSEVADRSARMGMKISERRLRIQLGLPEPEDDDDILIPAGSPQAPVPVDAARFTTAAKQSEKKPDAFEAMAEDVAEDYEDIINPIAELLERATAESKDFDEFSQKLLELADEMDLDGVADMLAKGSFMANIAGQLDAKLEE